MKTLILSILLASFTSHAAERTVSVTGECHKKLVPDRSGVSISVESRDKKLDVATAKMNEKYSQLQKKVLELKLKDMELKTTHYNVTPEYDWHQGKQSFKGHFASMGLRVSTSEIDRLPLVLDLATELGVGQVGGLELFLSDELVKKEYKDCLGQAAKSAKEKALVLAQALDAKVGKVQIISESATTATRPTPVFMRSMNKGMQSMEAESASIDVGKEDFKVTVQAAFDLN